jgi:hypothetical protein
MPTHIVVVIILIGHLIGVIVLALLIVVVMAPAVARLILTLIYLVSIKYITEMVAQDSLLNVATVIDLICKKLVHLCKYSRTLLLLLIICTA